MAIGTMTETAAQSDKMYVKPKRVYVTFAGDGAYPAGGTADFEASVREDLGFNGRLVGFEPDLVQCGGYVPFYDAVNDKLYIYFTNAAGGVLIEDTTANQSGRTYGGWLVID